MRTSNLLPEECREEIRALIEKCKAEELGADKLGYDLAGSGWRITREALAWVLGEDDHED